MRLQRSQVDRQTCRICTGPSGCQSVCEQGLQIDWIIHHDVLYEHYRNLGLEGFLAYPLTPWARREAEAHFSRRLAAARSCTRCGRCEERCPHGLPIMDMLEDILQDHPPLIEAVRERGWAARYADAAPPYRMAPAKSRRSE